ncbi:MAG: PD-(D/E)XK nuclease family protein [Nitrospirota bacterium]
MLTVICGPFHPHLEQALSNDLIAAKANDPLAPLLVVVPSESLRRRVVGLLAGERRQAFLNLSILTFHQWSRRLVEEATGRRHPALTDDHAFEELTRFLLERSAPGGPFAGVAATRGGCAALWQTLRDLKDAKVPPEAFVDAVSEGVFPEESATRLSALATLYRDVLAASRSAEWIDYTDLDAAAAEAALKSPYLHAQRTIAYYGFYDLTQAQYDVLRAVATRAETAVYFPVVSGDAAWAFAERFLRRYLVGLTTRPLRVLDGPAPARSATVVTCSGANDEVAVCAKEILRLVEEEGVAFEDIGVVARSLEPYADTIAREFGRHGIPFVTTAQRSLSRFPLAQAAVRLLRIAEGEPTRDDVVDVLSSPWCRVESLVPGAEAAPAWWSELARSIGVIRGYEAWALLGAASGPEGSGEGESATRGDQAAVLLRAVYTLRDACAGLPEAASASAHAEAWHALLESLLGVSPEAELEDGDEDEAGDDAVSRALIAAFADPARLDPIRPIMTRQAYVESVRRRIEATVLPMTDRRGRGVLVSDATAARGVEFRVLFVLGLNDGAFPRVVREDAFLRDHDRRLIETTLGYKIPEKLAGYDEERLLFAALVQAGRERLVLLNQRADDAGRELAPSWYLAAWQQAAGAAIVEVPRRMREKLQAPPFDRLERYTPREAAILAALLGADASRLADDRTAAFLARAGRLRRAVDAWGTGLSSFDGDLGPPREWLAEVLARGYTATGLKTYAECPWRYFLTEVLGIAPPADVQERAGPTVRDWGLLAHETLARASRAPAEPIDSIWREVCDRHARRHAIGYPLAWELGVERFGRVLAEALADDREELARSGYAPIEVEVTLSGVLGGGRDIPIRGRLDRIDAGTDGGLRVIDWKVQWARSGDRRADPVAAALRGQALQPPLYAALARARASTRGEGRPVAVAVYAIRPRANDPPVSRARYEPDADTAERIRTTIATLVDGIEAGVFPMIPDVYCARCDVSIACRRRHAPSRARAERDPRTGRIAGVRRTPVRVPEAAP